MGPSGVQLEEDVGKALERRSVSATRAGVEVGGWSDRAFLFCESQSPLLP